ncbi:Mut7-C RNAse domain-containing protein [Marinobacter hydrocarbonoclasticus]|nr:Mut7-C RNAse domain-containing protein [Marinobacter nauticus]
MKESTPRFLADAMLIRLARWLRALGYDTRLYPEATDAELVLVANREARWLLTRDKALLTERKPNQGLYVPSQVPLEQLAQILHHFHLQPSTLSFSRCLLCNTPLEAVDASLPLPDYAAHLTSQPRRRCPDCHRQYWFGAHGNRMLSTLRTAGLLR